ncbi:MAG: hypothetical protein K2W82_14555 [Candidatus Obscuribacterales bacterium]|nr:hypothetical protein [Candidatus Obscuribacterales bacterium]
MKIKGFCIYLVLLSLFLSQEALAFGGKDLSASNSNGKITREALKGQFSETNLRVVVEANDAQEKVGTEAQAEARRHFADARFASSLGYIDREKKRALNYASEADADPACRGRALQHFGEMLHAVQDFYSHTNYLQLMLENPLYKDDPYNIPLVDWQKVPDGYVGLKCCTQASDSAFNKVAFDLALRETQRQWHLFEAMLRNRCGIRSAAVIAALKQANPELKAAQDMD